MRLRTRLFRLLMLHQGEGRIVLFLSLIAALTGFGLSIGRASSDALFFTQYGADNLPLMFALIALVLVPLSLGYAAFVTGVGDTVAATRDDVYAAARNLCIPKAIYRTDIGKKVIETDEPKLKSWGWI